jgi:hypothetical protein
MADITKCNAEDCPLKNKCYRYTSEAGVWQSYFLDAPYQIVKGKFTCEMFWGDNAEAIWNTIKEINQNKDEDNN